jgi:lipopolysaccharide export LptBFGC system permease protein LptF
MPLKIFRYILVKFNSTFVAAVAVFTTLFLMDQASRQVEQLAPHAQNLRDFVISFLLLAPHLLAYTVPLAFLLAMIWTLEQMKQERELTAVLSTGTSPIMLILPFQAMSLIVSFLVYLITTHMGPATFQQYNKRLDEMTRRSFLSDLKPGTFFKGIPGTLILVGGFNQDSGVIDGLLMVRKSITDMHSGEMIIAERGLIEPQTAQSTDIVLKLESGAIHPLASARVDYRSGSFQSLTSKIQSQLKGSDLNIRQILMAASNSQLKSWQDLSAQSGESQKIITYSLELNRRLALPIAVLLYPFIVFPAAVSTGRHGKSAAFSGSLLIFLATFFFNSVGSSLAHQGLVPPVFGAWLADLLLLTGGLTVFTIYAMKQRIPRKKSLERLQ